MLVTDSTWERIRGKFTESEKAVLRKAAMGQTVCPPGVVIDLSRVPSALGKRLYDEVGKVG